MIVIGSGFTIPQMTRGCLNLGVHRALDDPRPVIGIYSDTPGDAGGPTNYECTIATVAAWHALHGMPPPDETYMRNLPAAEAGQIIGAKFFIGSHLERLPVAGDGGYSWLAYILLAINVGSGPIEGVEILQHVLGDRGHDIGRSPRHPDGVDGSYGALTAAATLAEWNADPVSLIRAALLRCHAFYLDIGRRHPEDLKFEDGWSWRLAQFWPDGPESWRLASA